AEGRHGLTGQSPESPIAPVSCSPALTPPALRSLRWSLQRSIGSLQSPRRSFPYLHRRPALPVRRLVDFWL
uniref:Uncharacterized protein n=1 Tax=Aegilops tauschii subsp. strangulata TaxID=200361 RepID=A0A453P1X0_AEGTS